MFENNHFLYLNWMQILAFPCFVLNIKQEAQTNVEYTDSQMSQKGSN